MRFKQINPRPLKQKYRLYSPTAMHNAYKYIKDENASVCRAAKIFGVPEQTLRDRIHGKIDPDCVTTGRAPVLSLYEESKIVDHLKTMAGYGYGYTKQETVDIATDYAIRLGKRTKSNRLTLAWFEGFRNRWPDVKVHKPRSLEQLRAKMANEKNVNTYFDNLRGTLDQYDLHDKPHLIFNIDEKGISLDHKPPHIVHVHANPPAVTTGKSKTVTVLGCGSASGVAIPPYFVFAGKRMNPDLLAGKCAGADGTVSETGWSNGAIFRHWIEHHFIKYIPGRTNEPVLLMLDGHKSHVSVGLAEWALEQNIVIFVLPAHCSHILQPFDVACFGPFQKIYNIQCHKLIRETSATICRYNVCELACKAYTKAVSPENLQSGFRKTGIFPLDKAAIPQDKLLPADVYQESAECSQASEASTVEGGTEVNKDEGCSVFMKEKEKELKRKKSETEKQRKTRKTMSKIVSGKEMSTESVIEQMKEHELSQNKRKPDQMQTKEKSVKKSMKIKLLNKQSSPKPGPSTEKSAESPYRCEISDSESDNMDTEPCCVCNARQPIEISRNRSVKFVEWAQCDGKQGWRPCLHWVHLKYCCPIIEVTKGQKFYCPHCVDYEE